VIAALIGRNDLQALHLEMLIDRPTTCQNSFRYLRKIAMKRLSSWTAIFISILLLTSCSSDGNDTDDPFQASGTGIDDLAGTYNLTGITVIYDNGDSVTEDDYDQFSGTMTISPDGLVTKSITIDGHLNSGESTIIGVESDALEIRSSQCASYWVDIYRPFAGDLTIVTPSGAICGHNDAQVTEYWKSF
jgi:hypothetical protein